jgi:hypothetical protein
MLGLKVLSQSISSKSFKLITAILIFKLSHKALPLPLLLISVTALGNLTFIISLELLL